MERRMKTKVRITSEAETPRWGLRMGGSLRTDDGKPATSATERITMKKIIVLAVALVTAAFGLRTTTVDEPVVVPTTTTVVEQQSFFGAHDVLQEELSDSSSFAG